MNLSTSQYLVLDYIKKFIAKNNYAPTVREIMCALALKSPSTVHEHIKNLARLGYIEYEPNKSRTIELLVDNEYLNDFTNTVRVKALDSDKCMELPIKLLNGHGVESVRFIESDKTILIVELSNQENIICKIEII